MLKAFLLPKSWFSCVLTVYTLKMMPIFQIYPSHMVTSPIILSIHLLSCVKVYSFFLVFFLFIIFQSYQQFSMIAFASFNEKNFHTNFLTRGDASVLVSVRLISNTMNY